MPPLQNWIDRAVGVVAPAAQLRRVRARIATDLIARHYEAAEPGRRTSGWRRTGGDANAVNTRALGYLREHANDLVRNNGQIRQAIRTIGNHVVGWGIVPKSDNAIADARWKAWAESTACDADGRDDFYGLQKLVLKGVATNGEMLVRKRVRRLEDGLPIPVQLHVLEPDFLDTGKMQALPNGGVIIQGVEFDALGRRVAYWLFPTHPGSSLSTAGSRIYSPSRRIAASEIQHIFERDRAGQVRAATWLAAMILPAKDLDEYGDAQRMKQKIAACLAVITSDVDGMAAPLGDAGPLAGASREQAVDRLEPGMILNVPPGRTVDVVKPPSVGDYGPYVAVEERRLAKGIGLSYEDFTGDYSNVNFSSARMARLEHYENVHDWRWRLMVPQLCNPAWGWAMEALQIAGVIESVPLARWTAPPMPMTEPDKEGLAVQRNVRTGIQTLFDAIRERGYDPEEFLAEYKAGLDKLDALGIVLDSDARRITQSGQAQATPADGAAA